MKIINIGSGSTGNATFVWDGETLVLIDAGLGKIRLNQGLQPLQKSIADVDGVFFTHAHGDHTKSYELFPLEKRFGLPSALLAPADPIRPENRLTPFASYRLKSLEITPIRLVHDAECCGYAVRSLKDGERFVNITDTGFIPEKSFPYISDAEYYLLESNHDPEMLLNSDRSPYLKSRIMADTGHLNNCDASYYLSLLAGEKTKAVLFGHISRDCNTPEHVLTAFAEVFRAQKGGLPSFEVRCLRHDQPTVIGQEITE